jgi:hypothetical protein
MKLSSTGANSAFPDAQKRKTKTMALIMTKFFMTGGRD